eukprot:TRINITY_DN8456_c0_g1_i1.p1 TRINITY_DN8456_c0_g1~~TRINITY_DN8456_c0_g1_i1.p1  ORF type:complete len:292 (+),score=52.60 TRINITY_DN8456_c0_g1_i1:49-924(+)
MSDEGSNTVEATPEAQASPAPQKRVLTAAEKEQILRQRKKARLQDPSRLNYILGASSSLSSPTAAPVPPADPQPTQEVVTHTKTHDHKVEPLLDDTDGEPAVPSPPMHHNPINPFHRSLLPTPDSPGMDELLRQMTSAAAASGQNPTGGIPGFPAAPGGSGAALGSIGMMLGQMLWNKWQNSSPEPTPAAPSAAKIMQETIRILPWIVMACLLAWVASQPGSVVVNVPLSGLLLYTATSWIRPFSASSTPSATPSITDKLMAPIQAWRWGWAQLQLFVFVFVLFFALLQYA